MAKYFEFKTGNMAKPQRFILYPYTGGDIVNLQSDKRFMQANIRTGSAIMNGKNKTYANSVSIIADPLPCTLPEDIKTAIQAHLWHNEGEPGNLLNTVHYDNKELFSN